MKSFDEVARIGSVAKRTFTEIAKRVGKTPEQLAIEAVQLHGTELKAATAFGVYPNVIRYWRKKAQTAEGKQ